MRRGDPTLLATPDAPEGGLLKKGGHQLERY